MDETSTEGEGLANYNPENGRVKSDFPSDVQLAPVHRRGLFFRAVFYLVRM
jgi:hypothetical protein